ncbi:S8 family serine peptidase [Streptomyces sp. NPDC054962]
MRADKLGSAARRALSEVGEAVGPGTSMAAPHLTGVCALMLQSSPTLTQDNLVLLLTSSARLDPFTGGAPSDDWGAGKVDAAAAVDSVT